MYPSIHVLPNRTRNVPLLRRLGSAVNRPLAFTGALLAAANLAVAQETATPKPRVTGQEQAAGSQVIINEVNTDAYPKVRVIASVLKDGQPVKGLTAADFRVREDEVDQEPLTVEEKKLALSVVVTLDTSGSMKKQLKDAQAAAISFLDALGAGDSAHVIGFAQDVKPLTRAFSNSRELASAAINATTARGNTALYDGLHKSLEAFQDRPGRKAIVLLSDGMDDDGTGKPLSKRKVNEVLALARQVNVPIYVIGLGKELDEAILQQIASETGGLYFNAPQASDLKQLYAQIGEQLAGQYAISYTSNLPPDGNPRVVQFTFLREKISDTKQYVAKAVAPTPPPQEPKVARTMQEQGPIAVLPSESSEECRVRTAYLGESSVAFTLWINGEQIGSYATDRAGADLTPYTKPGLNDFRIDWTADPETSSFASIYIEAKRGNQWSTVVSRKVRKDSPAGSFSGKVRLLDSATAEAPRKTERYLAQTDYLGDSRVEFAVYVNGEQVGNYQVDDAVADISRFLRVGGNSFKLVWTQDPKTSSYASAAILAQRGGQWNTVLDQKVRKEAKKGETSITVTSGPAGGYLGVQVEDVTSKAAEQFEIKGKKGAVATEVLPNSPANTAGLQPGDLIRSIGGQEVRGARDLITRLGAASAGRKVEIVVLRGETERTLTAELEEPRD